MQELSPGDTLHFRYQDEDVARSVVVLRRVSDESAGMADETKFFIASSLEVAATKNFDPDSVQCITLGTDGNAYLDGRLITVDLSW